MNSDIFLFPSRAINDKQLQPSAIKFLVSLCWNHQPGEFFFENLNWRAQQAGLSVNTAFAARQALSEAGYLIVNKAVRRNKAPYLTLPVRTDWLPITRTGWGDLLQPGISSLTCQVFLLLSARSRYEPAELSFSEICRELGTSRSRTTQQIKLLEELGLLQIERRTSPEGNFLPNLYSVIHNTVFGPPGC